MSFSFERFSLEIQRTQVVEFDELFESLGVHPIWQCEYVHLYILAKLLHIRFVVIAHHISQKARSLLKNELVSVEFISAQNKFQIWRTSVG